MIDPNGRTTFDADVIVVGAGPIGLTTAAALGHHGVRCLILEERTEPKPNSRANNVWARTQELLAGIGVRDALAEKSYRIEKQTQVLNGRPLDQVELDEVASPYPKVLYSGQDVIEATLSEQVAEKGGTVERGKKVTAVEQDDEGVHVSVVSSLEEDGAQDSQPERLRCRYLIGADGVQGTVRKAVGLDFETEKFEHRANRQIDAKLAWRRSTEPDQLWFFIYRNGFAGVLPVWGGYHRLFFLEDDAEMPDRDPTLEEIQARARQVTGDDTLTLSDPIWATHSRFQHGVSSNYARGRVYLVGDAGHFTLPIGGQGMNAGFHDAIGLAWRLAMTLAGHAGPGVLDSYDGERRGEHASIDENQATGMRRLVYRGKGEDVALNVAATAIPNIGARLFGTDDLQQLSTSYPNSPLSEDHLAGPRGLLRKGGARAGDRAPDARVTDGDGNTTDLFSRTYNPDGRTWGWSLLAFDGGRGDAGAQLLEAAAEVTPWDWVRPRLILAAPAAAKSEADDAANLLDLDEQAHAAYGLRGLPALVLVRPDGHIAFRGPAKSPEILKSFCERLFDASNVRT